MRPKQILLIGLTLLFFLTMVVLTFTARGIHNAGLPHVTAKRLTRESFSVKNTDGAVSYRQLAIPKTLYDADGVFVVVSRQVNGESRDFAQKVRLEIGMENESHYEITGGLSGSELLILSSDRDVADGDEIWVVK